MSSEVWLPIATLVVGIMLGYVADWLREKRTTERERVERWKAFQREAILDTQNLLASLAHIEINMLLTEVLNKEADEETLESQRLYAASVGEYIRSLHMLTSNSWRLADKELSAAAGSIVIKLKEYFEPRDHQGSAHRPVPLVGEELLRFNRRAQEV
jgi:hypothetical protein